MSLAAAIGALFRFYFDHIRAFDRIHPDVANGKMMPVGIDKVGNDLVFDGSFAKDFHRNLKDLENTMRKCRSSSFGFHTILLMSHVIRWVTVLASWTVPRYAFAIAALQFVVAPLSFPISVFKALTFSGEAVVHYFFAMALGPFIKNYGPVFTIDLSFIFWYIVVDQALNMVIYCLWSEPFGVPRLLRHIAYSFADTKVYHLVVFGCLRGLQVNIMLAVLTSALSMLVIKVLMPSLLGILGLPCYNVRFYMDHRLGHLPVVYEHAHKMHHGLHDSTPFSALSFGLGLNEQYFLTMLDALPCMLAPSVFFVPYGLSAWLIWYSLYDKIGHLRNKQGTPFDDDMNFHSDHHTLHVKNFALNGGALLDFYFGTQGHKTLGTNGLLFCREEKQGADGKADEICIKIRSAKTLRQESLK